MIAVVIVIVCQCNWCFCCSFSFSLHLFVTLSLVCYCSRFFSFFLFVSRCNRVWFHWWWCCFVPEHVFISFSPRQLTNTESGLLVCVCSVCGSCAHDLASTWMHFRFWWLFTFCTAVSQISRVRARTSLEQFISHTEIERFICGDRSVWLLWTLLC